MAAAKKGELREVGVCECSGATYILTLLSPVLLTTAMHLVVGMHVAPCLLAVAIATKLRNKKSLRDTSAAQFATKTVPAGECTSVTVMGGLIRTSPASRGLSLAYPLLSV